MKFLLCRPTHYGIDYSINPWMDINNKADRRIATKQWERLRGTIIKCGAEVLEIDPQPALPDMVFTANAGLIFDKSILLSKFKYPERQLEEIHFKKWFESQGYKVIAANEDYEGAGDSLLNPEKTILWEGYGFRSDKLKTYFEDMYFGIIHLKLVNPYFYHLDTCFCPLNNGLVMAVKSAFNEKTWELIKYFSKDLIVIDEEESLKFACNSILIRNNVIMPSGCPKTKEQLESKGYEVHGVDMSEFIKSGGACKCLVLNLG